MHRVLLVDDEPNLLQGLRRSLRGLYEVHTAGGGAEALELVAKEGPFAAVVSDMRMPGMDGAVLLAHIRDECPMTVRLMLTGNNEQGTAIRAINEGAIFRFVNKPCSREDLVRAIDDAIRQHQLLAAEKQLLENTLAGSIQVLTELLSLADARLFSRCTTVRERCRQMVKLVPADLVWQVESAAMLLPIGYIAIPPVVISRSRQGARLTPAEQKMMARIPEIGFELLNKIPRLDGVAAIVRYQNKDFDGGGVPHDAIAGVAIPLGARLLRILRDMVEKEEEGSSLDQILAGMLARKCYDPQLLRSVVEQLGSSCSSGPGAPGIAAIALSELKLGNVSAASITTNEGTVLVASGQTITQTVLERLHNFAATIGIKEPILVQTSAVGAASAS